jgi:uncharacterized phage protein (predicted DNA packaging)
MALSDLLVKVKANLILDTDQDDDLLTNMIAAAVDYAGAYQHRIPDYYIDNAMSPTTERGIIMLSSYLYESRDGSTGGFYADNVGAAKQVWLTVDDLLRLDRDWGFSV